MSEFKSITKTNEEAVFAAFESGRLTTTELFTIFRNSLVQLQCCQLRFLKNKSYCQIADIRGCSPSCARLNVKYAMTKLLKYLKEKDNDE